ncbi:MAG: radical SAM protein [Candidatus Alcyoniella australis]|nr:radical SAM protein [Candidatus Alcyoniella australis]
MAKIILIQSSSDYPERVVSQPIGLMSVAACLRQVGHQVSIYDDNLLDQGPQAAAAMVARERPDVVGLTAVSIEMPFVHRAATAIKDRVPGLPLVIGGAHATGDPLRTLADPNIDYVVVGEGERTFVELVQTLGRGGDPQQVPGLALRSDGLPLLTAERVPIEDLDALPLPAYELINVPAYFDVFRSSILFKRREHMALFTSRSCPYKCIYCFSVTGGKYRVRSAEAVVEEIDYLVAEYGIREVAFQDEVFNLQPERVKAICRLLIDRPYRVAISLVSGVRGDILDRETVRLLARAGVYRTAFGIESASPRIQREIRKNVDLERLTEAVHWFHDEGVICHGFFMIGLPGETQEEARSTIKMSCELPLDSAGFANPVPMVGSSWYKQIVAQAGTEAVVEYNQTYHHSATNYSAMDDVTLERMRRLAYRRFWLGNLRVLRLLFKVPLSLKLYSKLARAALYRFFPQLSAIKVEAPAATAAAADLVSNGPQPVPAATISPD